MKMAGVIAGLSLMLVIIAALRDTDLKYQSAQVKNGDIGLIQNLGMVLFKDYVLPFEISSVLFLSAMVGAVVIGKKD
jgi:NADH-quinone oxidoreductase subunit J